MSAVNIPGMPQIVRENQLVPVMYDIEHETLLPDYADLANKVSSRTVAVLYAQLWGVRNDLGDLRRFCDKHGLALIDDAAESFEGLSHTGSKYADMTFYSFGIIKTAAAFGGAITILRGPASEHAEMKRIIEGYRIETNAEFKARLKITLKIFAMTDEPLGNKIARTLFNLVDFDYKSAVVDKLRRSFVVGIDYASKFKLQINIANLAMLVYKMQNLNSADFVARKKWMNKCAIELHQNGVGVPGIACEDRGFWLFPVTMEDKDTAYRALNARGIDAYMGGTQLRLNE